MPSISVIGAVIERYESFAISATVPMWFHEVPAEEDSPPYVVLVDEGTTPQYTTEYEPLETTRLRFEIFHTSLAGADNVVSAIRYNAGAIAAQLGMDFAASLPLTGSNFLGMKRDREQRFVEGPRGLGGVPIFRVSMSYTVTAKRTA
jgi:hypothetical protein